MSSKEFKISKEDYDRELSNHLKYLAMEDFIIEAPERYLSGAYKEKIKLRGHWYQALEAGDIKPITRMQYNFVTVVNGNYANMGVQATEWLRYKELKKNWEPIFRILNKADIEELNILSDIIKLNSIQIDDIIEKMDSCSQTLNGFMGDDNAYEKIILKVAKKLKLSHENRSISQREQMITTKVLNDALSKMSEAEKNKFEIELLKLSKENNYKGLKTGSVFATLGAAQLSGFGVYLLATSTLSTLSGIIGVTLPFAAYTALTSSIAFITGPAGWVGAGVYALWKYTDVDYKKLIPAIIYLHWLREKYQ
jgi:uncharacterized protein YaaW (UPF0174 family)